MQVHLAPALFADVYKSLHAVLCYCVFTQSTSCCDLSVIVLDDLYTDDIYPRCIVGVKSHMHVHHAATVLYSHITAQVADNSTYRLNHTEITQLALWLTVGLVRHSRPVLHSLYEWLDSHGKAPHAVLTCAAGPRGESAALLCHASELGGAGRLRYADPFAAVPSGSLDAGTRARHPQVCSESPQRHSNPAQACASRCTAVTTRRKDPVCCQPGCCVPFFHSSTSS